jgi:hypothetical protein
MEDYYEKLNKYYTLKNNYQENTTKVKNDISDNPDLSRKDKRKLFLEKKPKCINCNRPVGSIFETSITELIKTLKAKCGSTIDPCPLNLELNIGYYLLYSHDLKNAEEKINKLKLQIILLKNNLLFNYGNKTHIMSEFNRIKDDLTSEIDLYEYTLSQYNQYLNIHEREKINNDLLNDISQAIELFQSKCKEYELTPSHTLLQETIDIYIEQIIPLIEEKNKNNFHIIKTRYNIENLEMIIEIPEIVSWVEGMPIKKKKEKEPKPEKKKKEKEPKPEKEKKVKTIKIIPEDKLVKPKRTLKKKIGTIILEGDPTEGKGLEDFENSEEINEITDLEDLEERKGITINEEQNQEIFDGAVTYPHDYFEGGNMDDEDEEMERLNLGGYLDNSLLGIEEI